MRRFPVGHATHPQWPMAAGLVLAQLRAQMALPGHARQPTLGLLYITDHYAAMAAEILDHLAAELPEVTDWSGTVGVGIAAPGVEYFDEPGLAVMLCDVAPQHYRVFSGVAPLPSAFEAHSALVHADAGTTELTEVVAELSGRMHSGYLFGGLASSRADVVQFAVGGNGNMRGHGRASGVFRGGLSGVAFTSDVPLVSRVTQGCHPFAPAREVTSADGNLVLELDGEAALDVLLRDLDIRLDEPQAAMSALRATLAGLTEAGADAVGRGGHFGSDVVVRHLIGLDPRKRGVAIASPVSAGMRLAFCRRDVQAARTDLVRICSEIREEVEPEELTLALASGHAAPEPVAGAEGRIAGAIYVSCAGRGGPHFGGPSAELQIVRRALGDVPLVGFFAGGEIARHHVYGYTGVLTVFRAEPGGS